MNKYLQIGVVFLLCTLLSQCYDPNKPGKSYDTIEDLERAIEAIEDRKEAELKIIAEEERIISIKESNLEKANSEGMKKEIRLEITAHRSALSKAHTNLNNQDQVLNKLYQQLDSLRGLD
jgi:predicted RNase H-like nuclease (RuvC/YqgF family)